MLNFSKPMHTLIPYNTSPERNYWKFLRKVTRSWSYESDPLWASKVTRLS